MKTDKNGSSSYNKGNKPNVVRSNLCITLQAVANIALTKLNGVLCWHRTRYPDPFLAILGDFDLKKSLLNF